MQSSASYQPGTQPNILSQDIFSSQECSSPMSPNQTKLYNARIESRENLDRCQTIHSQSISSFRSQTQRSFFDDDHRTNTNAPTQFSIEEEEGRELLESQNFTQKERRMSESEDELESQKKFFLTQLAACSKAQRNSSSDINDEMMMEENPEELRSFSRTLLEETNQNKSQLIFIDCNESKGSRKLPKSHNFSQSQESSSDSSDNENGNDEDEDLEIPKSILLIYNHVERDDWAFLWILSGYLCFEVFPMGAYNNLKLSLLLSLASISKNSTPIQIIAIGRETSHANFLMNSIGKNLATRFITSTKPDFDGSHVDEKGVIEAGPLMMGTGGVMYIGDWTRLTQKTVSKLLREIETGFVTIEKVQHSVPLETSIWAYWSSSTKIGRDMASLNQFVSVFGIPIMIDDAEYEEAIAEDILAPIARKTSCISENDMRDYIEIVAKRNVVMEPEADEMLREYYKATRQIRPDALSSKAFETLKKLAESHAKLCLRQMVNTSDVLAAINISENYIRSLFGNDRFSAPSQPKVASTMEIGKFKTKLQDWWSSYRDILERPV